MDMVNLYLSVVKRAGSVFRKPGGLLHMAQAVRAGIHRDTLRVMVEQGELERSVEGCTSLSMPRPRRIPIWLPSQQKCPMGDLLHFGTRISRADDADSSRGLPRD